MDNLGPLSSPEENDPDQFLNKAKQLVRDEILIYQSRILKNQPVLEVYVVWFAKVLGNWKALVSSNIADGQYYEVTYDGTKKVAYIDTYGKIRNTPVYDTLDADEIAEQARQRKLEEYGNSPW